MTNAIETIQKVTRKWTDLDSKVKAMVASGFTVGSVQTALLALGWDAPTWAVLLITIGAIFVSSYWTKSSVKVTDSNGSSVTVDADTWDKLGLPHIEIPDTALEVADHQALVGAGETEQAATA